MGQKSERSFAIVADKEVMENCRESVEKYAASIEEEGIRTFILTDVWGVPDSLRARLQSLHYENNLEGAVLIGNIPVPMIRNGQHLTTAFKMDQRRDWKASSVPSDRFYDDFGLKFDFIKRDSTESLYFYYNLSPDGDQSVHSDIYSARIKPPVIEGKSRLELISDFLEKAVVEKRRARQIDQLTLFAGHGYNSDCMVARIDERLTLTSQFSALRNGYGNINYIDHTYDDYIKYRLMAEVSREDLDIAILHHHGSDDMQFLNGSPQSNMTSDWIAMSRKFFRGKIRRSDDTTAAKEYYIENYDVPESWVSDAFDPDLMMEDSIADASLDIHIDDLKGYKPGARFVMIDACFTGSFHLEDYLSGHYIFSEGSTVVVKANSVNTLQDIWTNKLIGLLDLGVSVGNWAKEQFTLESHLMGDPTYRFASSDNRFSNLDKLISTKSEDVKLWNKMVESDHPEVKALAMKMLFDNNSISSEDLFSIQQNEKEPTVRLMAFHLINSGYSDFVVPSLKAGLYDSYELIRRFAAKEASTNASPMLLNDIMKLWVAPGTSERVEFQLKGAAEIYPKELALAAFDAQFSGLEGKWYDNKMKRRERLEYSLSSNEKDFNSLLDTAVTARNKRFAITALRNSNNVSYLEKLFEFMEKSEEDDLRVLLAEAFGWFTNSWKKEEIIDFCKKQYEIEKNEAVKSELYRTISRLSDNMPLSTR